MRFEPAFELNTAGIVIALKPIPLACVEGREVDPRHVEWNEGERFERQPPSAGIVDVMLASLYIMQARITQAALELDPPEVLIQPPLGV